MAVARLRFLDKDEERLIDQQSIECLETIGVKVKSDKVLRMLAGAGAEVDERTQVALISESMVREALRTVPKEMHGTIMTITIAKDNVE